MLSVGEWAVAASSLVLLVYSGLLFDPVLFRRESGRIFSRDVSMLLFANYLLIPLLTLAVIRCLSFSPIVNLVLLTMALLPCASMVPPLVSVAGEPAQRALFVFLLMSLLNLLVVPVLMSLLALPWVAGGDARPAGGEVVALLKYLASVFGPMSIGAALRLLNPVAALRWQQRLRRILPTVLIISFVLFLYSNSADVLALGWHELEALLIFELICIAIGLWLARRTPGNRVATVLICAMRNVVMGLTFTVVVFPHTNALGVMLAFTNLVFAATAVGLVLSRRLAARAVPS